MEKDAEVVIWLVPRNSIFNYISYVLCFRRYGSVDGEVSIAKVVM